MVFLAKTKRIFFGLVGLGLVFGGYAYARREKSPAYDFVRAERKDVAQEVSVTGRVEPAAEVELAFERSGKVARVNAMVSDRVAAGQILVTLSNADLVAEVNQAKAAVASAEAQFSQYRAALEREQAKLDELKRGPRPEELRVYETKADNARLTTDDARKSIIDAVGDSATRADDAVRHKSDQFFDFPRSSAPQIKFQINQQTEIDLESGRVGMERILTDWQSSLAAINSANATSYQVQAGSYLERIKKFLDLASAAVNNLTPTAVLAQTTIDGWKADVSSARASINTAIANLTAVAEKRQESEAVLAVALRELELKRAGSIPEQITAQAAAVRQAEANVDYQEAQIKQAEANLESASAQLGKTVIRAPFAGVVTKQEAKIGAIVAANAVVVSVISPAYSAKGGPASGWKIEANVPEADITKLSLGNEARVTLDAYDSDVVFKVKIAAIDPAETIIDGVATYKVTFQFIEADERIKPGMTVNIDVLTAKREQVIVIPSRAVIVRDDQKKVQILDGSTVREAEVETGLRGSDGNIEITAGVDDGDKVIVEFE